jgi:hypothetical protein
MINVSNATVAIKRVGANNVRVTPVPGQSITDGDHQIEINDNGVWSVIVTGVKKPIAEQIISQALNRVICG